MRVMATYVNSFYLSERCAEAHLSVKLLLVEGGQVNTFLSEIGAIYAGFIEDHGSRDFAEVRF